MRYTDYAQLLPLNELRLRAVSRGGDPQERLWAHWALGVKLGDDYRQEALAALDRERAAGVRRHLLVMLAGFGERRLVEQVAVYDPDPRARATACTQLARVGGYEELLLACCDDEAPEVRAAIVATLEPWPDVRVLERLAADESLNVRSAVLDRMLRIDAPWAAKVVEERLEAERDPMLRRRLRRHMGVRSAPPPRRARNPYLPMVI